MSKGKIVWKVIQHALLLLIAYILQGLVFPYIPLRGMVPLILPVTAAAVAMFEGGFCGALFGLFAGMFCAISFNAPTMMFTLTLTAVGLAVGWLGQTVVARGLVSYLVMCAAALLLCSAVQSFSLLFFQGQSFGALALEGLLQTAYSLLFAIPVYFAARAVSRGVVPA